MTFPTALPPSRLANPMKAPAPRWRISGTGWTADHSEARPLRCSNTIPTARERTSGE